MYQPPTEEEKQKRIDWMKQALVNASQRANVVMDSVKKDPEQLSLGKAIQKGTVGGFVPKMVRDPIGGAVGGMAPMDTIIGGSVRGEPLTALSGITSLATSLSGAYVLDKALQGAGRAFAKTAAKKVVQNVKKTAPKKYTRDSVGKFSKTDKEPTKYISDLRNDVEK
jgi:hypothetical protein